MPSRTLFLLLPLLLPACQAMPPEAWASALRPDFSTPEETGRSFFAAWAAKEPANEYKCLAESFKAEVGATLDVYLIYRPELEKQIGWVGRHAYKLQPLSSEQLANGNVLVWWGRGSTTFLGLEMERQGFFDFYDGKDPKHRIGGSLKEPLEDHFEFSGKEVMLYLENSSIRSAGLLDDIAKFEIGEAWKIAGMIQPSPGER